MPTALPSQHNPGYGLGGPRDDGARLQRVQSASIDHTIRDTVPTPAFIEAYFRQWDDDKHLNLGTFIVNNIKQALDIVKQDSLHLEKAYRSMQLTDGDMDEWACEEAAFFATLADEELYDPREVAYVELLQQLPELDAKRSHVVQRFLEYDPSNADQTSYDAQMSQTRRIETQRQHAIARYERTISEVESLELQLQITTRWTATHPKYQATVAFMNERRYRRALGRLQALVIQRLFELHKLNLSQTGTL